MSRGQRSKLPLPPLHITHCDVDHGICWGGDNSATLEAVNSLPADDFIVSLNLLIQLKKPGSGQPPSTSLFHRIPSPLDPEALNRALRRRAKSQARRWPWTAKRLRNGRGRAAQLPR